MGGSLLSHSAAPCSSGVGGKRFWGWGLASGVSLQLSGHVAAPAPPALGPWRRTPALGGDLLGMWLGAGPSWSWGSYIGHVEG